MRISLQIALLSAGLIFLAVSARSEEAADCVEIQSSLVRLDCYDRVFGRIGPVTPGGKTDLPEAERAPLEVPSSGKGDLAGTGSPANLAGKSAKFGRKPDSAEISSWLALPDQSGFKLVLNSESRHRNIIGQTARLRFEIACRDDATSLSFSFGGNIVASLSDVARISISLDGREPRQREFTISQDFKQVGLWTGARSIPIIKSLFDAKAMQVNGVPFFSRPVTSTFSVQGLKIAIKPLREQCGW